MCEHKSGNRIDIPDNEIDNVYIRGFRARDLMVLATMLEKEKITPIDLNDYIRNIEHFYTVLEQDFNERVSNIIVGYFDEEDYDN